MAKKSSNNTERLAIMETNINYIKEELTMNKAEHREIMDKIDSFIESNDKILADREKKFDEKYASKTTEKVVYALIGMILMAFAYGLFELVFKR